MGRIPRLHPDDREWDLDDIESLEEPYTEDDLLDIQRDLKDGATEAAINEALLDNADDLEGVL